VTRSFPPLQGRRKERNDRSRRVQRWRAVFSFCIAPFLFVLRTSSCGDFFLRLLGLFFFSFYLGLRFFFPLSSPPLFFFFGFFVFAYRPLAFDVPPNLFASSRGIQLGYLDLRCSTGTLLYDEDTVDNGDHGHVGFYCRVVLCRYSCGLSKVESPLGVFVLGFVGCWVVVVLN